MFAVLAFLQRAAFNSQSVNAHDHRTAENNGGNSIDAARAALVFVGFSAIVGQIVLMRELIVAFNGNEVSLGIMLVAWLLWTAVGSGLASLLREYIRNPRRTVAMLECLMAAGLIPTVWALRISKGHFQSVPGELVGLLPMLLSTLVCLSVFCVVSGALFVIVAKLLEQECRATSRVAAGSAYLLEAAGSAIGGILANVALLRFLDSFQIAFIIGLLNLGMAAALMLRSRRWVAAGIVVITFAAIPLLTVVAPRLDKEARTRQWSGFDLIASRDTVYGNLAVTQTGALRSIYTDGVIIANAPDPAAAEEAVHYALLEHPAPRRVLLIGGSVNGAVAEVLKHPSVEQVDLVELDPALIEMADQFFPPQTAAPNVDARTHLHIHTHLVDGRRYLKATNEIYDAIIVNVADPQTAQLNRFYTAEFFRDARDHLASGGLLAIQLRSSEETLSPDLGVFLSCIRRTLAEQFPAVIAIPGETIHFVASTGSHVLTSDPQVLMDRMRRRELNTQYVSPYFIPFRLSPDRVRQIDNELQPLPSTAVNRDFAPVAYYFNGVLWSAQFSTKNAEWLRRAGSISFQYILGSLIVLLVAATLSVFIFSRNVRPQLAAAGSTAATGFTLMALQILLLLGFEAVYGYVYHQLAILMGLLMAGIAMGSWLALRQSASLVSPGHRLAIAQVALALAGPALLLSIGTLENLNGGAAIWLTTQLAFPALAALAGMLGGYQFVIAAHAFLPGASARAGLGALYAIDLLGGCLGALVLSTYLIPVFGFWKTAWLMMAVNLAAALPALRAGVETSSHPARSFNPFSR